MRNILKITTLVFALVGGSICGAMAATHDSDEDQTPGGVSAPNIAAPTYGIAGAVTGAAHLNGSNRDGTGVTPPAAARMQAQRDTNRTASADRMAPATN